MNIKNSNAYFFILIKTNKYLTNVNILPKTCSKNALFFSDKY